MIDLRFGDCLDILPTLEKKSVDAIITDIPYGTTACAWDAQIPLDGMWKNIERTLKKGGAFITTAMQPFTSVLVTSKLDWFQYELIYEKTNPKGFLNAKYRPLTAHENILIFCDGTPSYTPQKWRIPEYLRTKRKHATAHTAGEVYGGRNIKRWDDDGSRFPTSVIGFSNRVARDGNFHPTQKPLALFEYLILTYTIEGNVVLDFCMGSGTTGIACMKLGRSFIGIEKDEKYYKTAEKRMKQLRLQHSMEFK